MRDFTSRITKFILRYFVFILLIIIVSLLSTTIAPAVLSKAVFGTILIHGSTLIILSLGMVFVLIAAEIDLSIIGVIGVAPYVGTWLIKAGLNPFLGIVVILIFGAGIGVVNGILVTKLKIPSLTATLATMFSLIGILMMLTRGVSFSGFGLGYTWLGTSKILGIRTLLWATFGFIIFLYFLLHRTVFGQQLYLTGADEEAARLTGLNTSRLKIMAFILSAVSAAFAGFCLSSRTGLISSRFGQEYLLPAIAAPVLGGVSLFGGRGGIFGPIAGALIFQFVESGLRVGRISGYFIDFWVGMLVLLAIVVGGLRAIYYE